MSAGKAEAINKVWETAMHCHGQASTAFITN
jgi:hypothetical protein